MIDWQRLRRDQDFRAAFEDDASPILKRVHSIEANLLNNTALPEEDRHVQQGFRQGIRFVLQTVHEQADAQREPGEEREERAKRPDLSSLPPYLRGRRREVR